MTEPDQVLWCRPPLGFIVEGRAEYSAYPTIASRVLDVPLGKIPRVCAKGFGGVSCNLESHLDDLISTENPWAVIVTVDLFDLIDNKIYRDCAECKKDLCERAAQWLQTSQKHEHLHPLPELVSIVLQVPKFESWMVADQEGLAGAGIIGEDVVQHWTDVDAELPNPARWLKSRCPNYDPKNPSFAKDVFTACSIQTTQSRSRSFRKFCKEVSQAYRSWETACLGTVI